MTDVITLGTDPECFLFDLDGNPVAAGGTFGGTKGAPVQFPKARSGYSFHEDNVTLELNIPPQTGPRKAYDALKYAMRRAHALALSKDLLVGYTDSLEFPADELAKPGAEEFGCDPDFDAYQGNKAERRIDRDFGRRRFAGFHIHVGARANCPDFVFALFMDLFTTLGIVRDEFDDNRLDWYGQPGIYRPKPYGIEYRTPGAGLLAHPPLFRAMFGGAFSCGQFVQSCPANELKTIFDRVPWVAVRELLSARKDQRATDEWARYRAQIMDQVRDAGVPI